MSSAPCLVLEAAHVMGRSVTPSSVELRRIVSIPRMLMSLSSVLRHGDTNAPAPLHLYEAWSRDPLMSFARALGCVMTTCGLGGSTQLTNWQLLQNLSGVSVVPDDHTAVRAHFRFPVRDRACALCRSLLRVSEKGVNEWHCVGAAIVFSDGMMEQDNVRCHMYTVTNAAGTERAACYLYEVSVQGGDTGGAQAASFYSLKVCVPTRGALVSTLCWAMAVRQCCDIDVLRQHIVARTRLTLVDLAQERRKGAGVVIWDA